MLPKDTKSIRPSFIEGGAMVVYNDRMYLYGGLGGYGMKNDMYEYNIKNNYWHTVEIKNGPVEGRLGHSALLYKQSMIIFGGAGMFNKRIKLRECYN